MEDYQTITAVKVRVALNDLVNVVSKVWLRSLLAYVGTNLNQLLKTESHNQKFDEIFKFSRVLFYLQLAIHFLISKIQKT